MKKFLVLLSLSIYIFSIFWGDFIFANERTKAVITKDIILKQRELKKSSSKWELYVQALDAYFEKYKDNQDAVRALVKKVSAVKETLWNTSRENEIKLLIEYIEYKNELIWTLNNDINVSIATLIDTVSIDEMRNLINLNIATYDEEYKQEFLSITSKIYTLPQVKNTFNTQIKDEIFSKKNNLYVQDDINYISSTIYNSDHIEDLDKIILKKIEDNSTTSEKWKIWSINYSVFDDNFKTWIKNPNFLKDYIVAYRDDGTLYKYAVLWIWCKTSQKPLIRISTQVWNYRKWPIPLFLINGTEYLSGSFASDSFLDSIQTNCIATEIPSLQQIEAADTNSLMLYRLILKQIFLNEYKNELISIFSNEQEIINELQKYD